MRAFVVILTVCEKSVDFVMGLRRKIGEVCMCLAKDRNSSKEMA